MRPTVETIVAHYDVALGFIQINLIIHLGFVKKRYICHWNRKNWRLLRVWTPIGYTLIEVIKTIPEECGQKWPSVGGCGQNLVKFLAKSCKIVWFWLKIFITFGKTWHYADRKNSRTRDAPWGPSKRLVAIYRRLWKKTCRKNLFGERDLQLQIHFPAYRIVGEEMPR